MEKSSESKKFGLTSSNQSKRVSLPLSGMVCFICNKLDRSAAGVMHASKTAVDKQHVKETIEKIKTMIIALDNKSSLAKLSSGDIASKKLNYHKPCYNESNREVSLQNDVNEFWKAVCLNKVITHVRETYVSSIHFEASAKAL